MQTSKNNLYRVSSLTSSVCFLLNQDVKILPIDSWNINESKGKTER